MPVHAPASPIAVTLIQHRACWCFEHADVQSSPLGFSYLVVIYEVRRSVGGAARTTTDSVYFISEGGTWRLWDGAAYRVVFDARINGTTRPCPYRPSPFP